MIKPWFLNLLLVLALLVAGGRLVDVVGREGDAVPEETPKSPAPRVLPVAKPRTAMMEFQDVIDRNLFEAGRGKAEPVADAPPPPQPPPVQPPKASLFGIMVDPEGNKFAFLRDDKAGGGAKAKRYREGESLAGAKIKEIRTDRVILTVGPSEHVISLRAPKEGLSSFQPPAAGTGVSPGVGRAPRGRRTQPATQPPSRRPAPVRRQTAPQPGGDALQGEWEDEENPFAEDPFGDNPFEENPFEENPFEENPFVDNPFEENPFGGGEEW
jgi:hypothetical protein